MACLVPLALLAASAVGAAGTPAAARAVLKNARGQEVGTARFAAGSGGVTVVLSVKDLPPGTHAFHVHAVGACDPPDFQSAGPHFNPTGRKHGLKNPEGHHLGDLPNIAIGPDGKGEIRVVIADVNLEGGPKSLLGPQGTALVIHEKPDDEKTDPAGNSGARIACGVVVREER